MCSTATTQALRTSTTGISQNAVPFPMLRVDAANRVKLLGGCQPTPGIAKTIQDWQDHTDHAGVCRTSRNTLDHPGSHPARGARTTLTPMAQLAAPPRLKIAARNSPCSGFPACPCSRLSSQPSHSQHRTKPLVPASLQSQA